MQVCPLWNKLTYALTQGSYARENAAENANSPNSRQMPGALYLPLRGKMLQGTSTRRILDKCPEHFIFLGIEEVTIDYSQ